ncbi:MAG: hypothetical protein PHU31_06435 [Anaerotignum sp.]|nr:hypothetical protein [Anaerotignum sp.]
MGATGVTAFAASQYNTPAELVAGITGRTVESVVTEKTETGKTYGTIASEAGVLEEFKAEALEIKKDQLTAQVAAGVMTQERANTIIAALEENQVNCDGTGSGEMGKALGAKFGANGKGMGTERGSRGQGMGLRDGSCN